MNKNKIAIVTVDFNEHEHTYDLLKSLDSINKTGLEVLTIVVDNGSKVALSLNKIESHKNTILLSTGINLGFTGGYNRGVKYAMSWGADYILIINNDTFIKESNFIQILLKTFESNKCAGMVSPKIYFAPGFEYHKKRYSKKNIGQVLWYAGGEIDWDNVYSVHRGLDEVDEGQYDKEEKTGFISGCCFMVKREVIEKLGYFDDRLFAYYEDFDYILRILAHGYELWYTGKASIYHKVSQTAGVGSFFTDYFLTRNRLYVGFKYAKLRTKFALIREALKQLIAGRNAQKKGVVDFIFKRYGSCVKQDKVLSSYAFDVSVAIVNYKTANLTLELLKSLDKYVSSKVKKEIVVLDNNSNDGLIDQINQKYPNIKTIQLNENLGFSGGYNRALNYCRGKYFLLLNSDTEVTKGSVEHMISFLDDHPEAVASCKLMLPDGSVQESAFVLPTLKGAIKKFWFGKKHAYGLYRPTKNLPQKVEGVVMAAFIVPATVYYNVGELSEQSFMYFEDVEYARRLKENKISVYYLPKYSILHHHGASAKKVGDKAQKYLADGANVYHGKLKAFLIYAVIYISQKISKIKSA